VLKTGAAVLILLLAGMSPAAELGPGDITALQVTRCAKQAFRAF
jgi:hypothetical protein